MARGVAWAGIRLPPLPSDPIRIFRLLRTLQGFAGESGPGAAERKAENAGCPFTRMGCHAILADREGRMRMGGSKVILAGGLR